MKFSRRVEPVSLAISDLTFDGMVWKVARPNGRFPVAAAIARFVGVYGHGSLGKGDARFIRWRLRELCELVEAQGLVVDFRELDYEWGDDLSIDTQLDDIASTVVVIREDRRAAFAGVLGEHALRTDYDAALDEVHAALRALVSRDPDRR